MGPRATCVALVVALLTTWASGARAASGLASPLVRVELLSEVQSISPGETFWVALRQQITPGWHTYWVNPGDSGEPARVEWALPPGFTAGEIAWPYPERIPVGPAMSYGYEREVVLPIPVTAPRDLTAGARVTLRGQASWLVCEKICIPEDAPVELTLPVAAGTPRPDPRGAPLIAAARRAVPTPSPWPASFAATPETVTLTVAARDLIPERIAEVWFYPARWGVIEHAAPQRSRVESGRLTLEVARGPLAEAAAAPLDGVLVIAERLDGGLARQAFAVRAEPRPAGAPVGLLAAMALALAGGLVLNLMPSPRARAGAMSHLSRRTFLAGTGLAALAKGGLAIPSPAWAAPKVGAAAPAFTAAATSGQAVSLADHRGKIVVLEWTNHDCPYVRKHYSTSNMQALQKEATGQGVVWLTIISSAPGTQGHVSPRQADELTVTRKASPTAVLLDPTGVVGKAYGATSTPHMYVIDKAGTLMYAGAIDDRPTSRRGDVQGAQNYVREALQAVAAGQPVKTPVTRAYGCTVKYA